MLKVTRTTGPNGHGWKIGEPAAWMLLPTERSQWAEQLDGWLTDNGWTRAMLDVGEADRQAFWSDVGDWD
jgi:hypothetical protein